MKWKRKININDPLYNSTHVLFPNLCFVFVSSFFCLLTVSPIDVHHQMVSCIRLLSELWGILSIGATSGLTMPHRCDNHPLSTWPSCRLSKNNTALFTVVRLYLFYQNGCERWIFLLVLSLISVSSKTFFSEKIPGHVTRMFSPVCIQCLICR